MYLYRYHIAYDTGAETVVQAKNYVEADRIARERLGLPPAKRRGGVKQKFCKKLD